jgi:hypothetical protein
MEGDDVSTTSPTSINYFIGIRTGKFNTCTWKTYRLHIAPFPLGSLLDACSKSRHVDMDKGEGSWQDGGVDS